MKCQPAGFGINRRVIYLLPFLLASCLSGGGGGGDSGSAGGAPAAPGTCSSVTYAAPSGAASNIVFTFDKAYTCGQFANGDWWVAKESSPFVTITSITPAAVGGKSGFEVNPSTTTAQAFDNGNAFLTYNAALMPALPLNLSGISSVVKAVSYTGPSIPNIVSLLQFAAVLTIVDSPVSNSSEVFRPGYFGSTGKTFYAVPSAATVTGVRVGTYTPVGVPSVAGVPLSAVSARFQQVQLDHYLGFAGRLMHPRDNMREYGADIALDNAEGLLRMLLSDFIYTDPAHKRTLINYLQMAIDLKSMAANGMVWDADAGHSNGRKLPLMFANAVFGGADFSNAIAASRFSEDQQVLRSGVTGEVLWGRATTEDIYWETTRVRLSDPGVGVSGGTKDPADFYGRLDGGGGDEIGISYQLATSMPWKYMVLALYMTGLETPPTIIPSPANNVLAEYSERWVLYGVKADDFTTNINLTTGVITKVPHVPAVCARPFMPPARTGVPTLVYGTDYGPNGAGGCIPGINNWKAVDNGPSANTGNPLSTFGDELWAWYR